MRKPVELTPRQIELLREAVRAKMSETSLHYPNSEREREMEQLFNLFPHLDHITLED